MVLLCSSNQTPKEPKPEEFGIKIQSPKSLGLAYIAKTCQNRVRYMFKAVITEVLPSHSHVPEDSLAVGK